MSQKSRGHERVAEQYASNLGRSRSKDEALEIAIKATETSMQALKLSQNAGEKTKWSNRVKQLLGDAERIKLSTDWRQDVSSIIRTTAPTPFNGQSDCVLPVKPSVGLEAPQSSRSLPKAEHILLLKASYLNGFKFPPWTMPPAPDEFELKDGEDLFVYVSSSHM